MLMLLASNSDWHHNGWFWFWPLMPLFWLLVIFLLARLFWRGRRGPWAHAGHSPPDARAILAARYARGEINHDEYRERLGNLEP